MAEGVAGGNVYPLRASGEYAGTKCQLKNCPKYARFLAIPMGQPDDARAMCANHVAAFIRTMHLLTGKSVVIQEVPGKWGRELIIAEDQLALLRTPVFPAAQG